MALINTTTTGVLGTTVYGDGAGALTVQENGVTINKITSAPAFSAIKNATQSALSSGTWTKIVFQTEEFDTASTYNTSTSVFTPNVAGYYQINLEIYTSGSGSTQGNGMIYKNGAAAKGSFAGISNGQCSVIPALIYLNGSTDYIEAYGYIGTASGVIAGDANYCYFQAWLARAA